MAGFVGVLIIVRPGLAGFNQFSLLALLSVAFCALRDLATRRIPRTVPSLFITLLTTMTVTSAGGVILVPLGGWTPPSTRALGLLALAAVLLLIGYQCIITALRTGDISAVAPFRYSALLWAMLLGYVVFGDVPDAMMVTGRVDHRAVRPLRLLSRARPPPRAGGGELRPAAGRVLSRRLKSASRHTASTP